MTNPNPDETPAHPGGCPSLGQMADYLDASDSVMVADQLLDRHIQDCTLCQAAIEELRGRRRGRWINALISEQKQLAERKLPVIAGFQVISEISSGGQGIVYYAIEEELNRPVALKFLKHGKFSSDLEIQQFFNEGLAIAALEHPAIIRLYGMKIHDGIPFLIMQWADQGSLADRLAQSRPTISQALALIEQVTRAISFAHANGIIHRDLKPSNILMKSADYGDCRISDFGLARKFSDSGEESTCTRYLGTPGFMAPEMISDDFGKPGPLSDLFSIGAIFYLLLTGRLAHAGNNPIEIHHLLLNRDPIPPRYFNPQIPRDLQTICLKCLEKEPHRRYRSAEELSADLELFRAGRPIRARRAGPMETGLKWCRRNKTLAATIFLFWLTTVAAAGYILILYQKSQAQLDKTRDTITYLAPMAKRIFTELTVTQVEKERLERSVDLMIQTGIESRNVEVQRNANFAVLELADIIAHWDTSDRPVAMARFTIENSGRLLKYRAGELQQIPDLYDRTELDQAQAQQWLADYLHFDGAKTGESETLYRQALAAAGNVVARRPNPVESLGVQGTIHNNLANCLASQKKFAEAEEHYQKGRICLTEVLKKNPENRVRYAMLARLGSQYGMFQWKFHDNPQPYLDYWDSHYQRIETFLKNQNQENWPLIAQELILGHPDRSHILYDRLNQLDKAAQAIGRKIRWTQRVSELLQSPSPSLTKSLTISKMDQLLIESRKAPETPFPKAEFAALLTPVLQLQAVDMACSALVKSIILMPNADEADYKRAVALLEQDEAYRSVAQRHAKPLDQLIAIFEEHQAKSPRHFREISESSWDMDYVMEPRILLELLKLEKMLASHQPQSATSIEQWMRTRLDHQLSLDLLVTRRLEDSRRRATMAPAE